MAQAFADRADGKLGAGVDRAARCEDLDTRNRAQVDDVTAALLEKTGKGRRIPAALLFRLASLDLVELPALGDILLEKLQRVVSQHRLLVRLRHVSPLPELKKALRVLGLAVRPVRGIQL